MFFCFELPMLKVHSKSGNMLSPYGNQFMTRQSVYKTHFQKKSKKIIKMTIQGKQMVQMLDRGKFVWLREQMTYHIKFSLVLLGNHINDCGDSGWSLTVE